MRRLQDVFTLRLDALTEDGGASGEGIRNYFARLSWRFPVRAPGEVQLTRIGTRIYRNARGLDSTETQGTRRFNESLFQTGFSFQSDDLKSENWRPQGLSGSADAAGSGKVDGRKFLLVGWYYENRVAEASDVWPEVDHGVWKNPTRVSLVDVTSMNDVQYRHILLVRPTSDGTSFEPAEGHCGGVVWYGRWLFVTGSKQLHVFDMDAILDLSDSNPDFSSTTLVGNLDGVGHAAGYRYIIPLVMSYALICDTLDVDPFATLGLDRTSSPHRLVAAAYVVEPTYNAAHGTNYQDDPDQRVVLFWNLGSGDLPYPLEASGAADTGLHYVQGVNAADDDVWLCRSDGRADPPVAKLNVATVGKNGKAAYPWPEFGEGLTYSAHSDHLWCVRELSTNERVCFCVFRDDVLR